jgi:hypothetical protein
MVIGQQSTQRFRMRKKIKPTPELIDLMLKAEFQRVGGDVICEICQEKIYDHPEIEGYPTFIVDCRGRLVKV